MGVRVEELARPCPEFGTLTFERFRPWLAEPVDPALTPLAVGAWSGDVPVGLALFSPSLKDAKRHLLSVSVSPLFRRQSVATRLLAQGEKQAAALGASKLVAVHSNRLPALQAYEALMKNAGWSAPLAFEHRACGRAGWGIEAARDWARFVERLRGRGFRLTEWGGMTAADRHRIATMVAEELPEEERMFDPFQAEQRLNLNQDLSVLIRCGDEIVGWILASPGAAEGSVYYSGGYVIPGLRRAGWLLEAVRAVCARQAAILGPDTVSIYETAAGNQAMRRFIEQQLRPYSLWTDVRYRMEKAL